MLFRLKRNKDELKFVKNYNIFKIVPVSLNLKNLKILKNYSLSLRK